MSNNGASGSQDANFSRQLQQWFPQGPPPIISPQEYEANKAKVAWMKEHLAEYERQNSLGLQQYQQQQAFLEQQIQAGKEAERILAQMNQKAAPSGAPAPAPNVAAYPAAQMTSGPSTYSQQAMMGQAMYQQAQPQQVPQRTYYPPRVHQQAAFQTWPQARPNQSGPSSTASYTQQQQHRPVNGTQAQPHAPDPSRSRTQATHAAPHIQIPSQPQYRHYQPATSPVAHQGPSVSRPRSSGSQAGGASTSTHAQSPIQSPSVMYQQSRARQSVPQAQTVRGVPSAQGPPPIPQAQGPTQTANASNNATNITDAIRERVHTVFEVLRVSSRNIAHDLGQHPDRANLGPQPIASDIANDVVREAMRHLERKLFPQGTPPQYFLRPLSDRYPEASRDQIRATGKYVGLMLEPLPSDTIQKTLQHINKVLGSRATDHPPSATSPTIPSTVPAQAAGPSASSSDDSARNPAPMSADPPMATFPVYWNQDPYRYLLLIHKPLLKQVHQVTKHLLQSYPFHLHFQLPHPLQLSLQVHLQPYPGHQPWLIGRGWLMIFYDHLEDLKLLPVPAALSADAKGKRKASEEDVYPVKHARVEESTAAIPEPSLPKPPTLQSSSDSLGVHLTPPTVSTSAALPAPPVIIDAPSITILPQDEEPSQTAHEDGDQPMDEDSKEEQVDQLVDEDVEEYPEIKTPGALQLEVEAQDEASRLAALASHVSPSQDHVVPDVNQGNMQSPTTSEHLPAGVSEPPSSHVSASPEEQMFRAPKSLPAPTSPVATSHSASEIEQVLSQQVEMTMSPVVEPSDPLSSPHLGLLPEICYPSPPSVRSPSLPSRREPIHSTNSSAGPSKLPLFLPSDNEDEASDDEILLKSSPPRDSTSLGLQPHPSLPVDDLFVLDTNLLHPRVRVARVVERFGLRATSAITATRMLYVDVPPFPLPQWAKVIKAKEARARKTKAKGKARSERSSSGSVVPGTPEIIELEPDALAGQSSDVIAVDEADEEALRNQEVAERDAAELSYHRLRESPCKWHGCDAVLNSADRLATHASAHAKEKNVLFGGFVCEWDYCKKRFLDGPKLAQHLRNHALYPLYCAYADCDASFAISRELVRHHKSAAHVGDALRPSVALVAPPPQNDLPPLPVMPGYMIQVHVTQPSVSRQLHRWLAPRVCDNLRCLRRDRAITTMKISAPRTSRRRLSERIPNVGSQNTDEDVDFDALMNRRSRDGPYAAWKVPAHRRGPKFCSDLRASEVTDLMGSGYLIWPKSTEAEADAEYMQLVREEVEGHAAEVDEIVDADVDVEMDGTEDGGSSIQIDVVGEDPIEDFPETVDSSDADAEMGGGGYSASGSRGRASQVRAGKQPASLSTSHIDVDAGSAGVSQSGEDDIEMWEEGPLGSGSGLGGGDGMSAAVPLSLAPSRPWTGQMQGSSQSAGASTSVDIVETTYQADGPTFLSSRSADVIISDVRPIKLKPEALRSVNVLLDEFLYNLLSAAGSVSTDKLKTSLIKILPTTLGKEAILEAELELKAYWERSPQPSPLNGTVGHESEQFDLQWSYELLRLKCEAYTTMNDTDEDVDAERRLNDRMVEAGGSFPPRMNMLAPAALYLTAILEHVCEHVLSLVGRVVSRDSSRAVATVQDLFVALCEDDTMYGMFKAMKVYEQIETLSKFQRPRRSKSFTRTSDRGSPAPRSPSVTEVILPSSPPTIQARMRMSSESLRRASPTTGQPGGSSPGRTSLEKMRAVKLFGRSSSDNGDSREGIGGSGGSSSVGHNGGAGSGQGSVGHGATEMEDAVLQEEFDELMRSGGTMKVSLTPDRLKSMEVYKAERKRQLAQSNGNGSTSPEPKRGHPGRRPSIRNVDAIVEDDEGTSPPLSSAPAPTSVAPTQSPPPPSSYQPIVPRPRNASLQQSNSAAALAANLRVRSVSVSAISENAPKKQAEIPPPLPSSTATSPRVNRSASAHPKMNGMANGVPPRTRRVQKHRESMDLDEIMKGSDGEEEDDFPPAPLPKGPNGLGSPTGYKKPHISASARELIDFLDEGPPEEFGLSPANASVMSFTSTKTSKSGRFRSMMSRLTIGGSKENLNNMSRYGDSPQTPKTPRSIHRTFSSSKSPPLPPPPPSYSQSQNGSLSSKRSMPSMPSVVIATPPPHPSTLSPIQPSPQQPSPQHSVDDFSRSGSVSRSHSHTPSPVTSPSKPTRRLSIVRKAVPTFEEDRPVVTPPVIPAEDEPETYPPSRSSSTVLRVVNGYAHTPTSSLHLQQPTSTTIASDCSASSTDASSTPTSVAPSVETEDTSAMITPKPKPEAAKPKPTVQVLLTPRPYSLSSATPHENGHINSRALSPRSPTFSRDGISTSELKDMRNLLSAATSADECRLLVDLFLAKHGALAAHKPPPMQKPAPMTSLPPLPLSSEDASSSLEKALVAALLGDSDEDEAEVAEVEVRVGEEPDAEKDVQGVDEVEAEAVPEVQDVQETGAPEPVPKDVPAAVSSAGDVDNAGQEVEVKASPIAAAPNGLPSPNLRQSWQGMDLL
ncbi:hypothetical protein EIP91_004819 [Steccherinum ochraceum]|uniref:C2H2-type domain-containing protein n=1 Tax=Steccherinum ochraceum TaxID=92696 RepID=A0A4R0RGG1_9APHY|nr:hypothetical protein EIP91_004819 [Steccherinum ochraceum]